MALQCPVCGASCPEGAERCPDCGAKLEAPPPPPEHPRLSMNWFDFLIKVGIPFRVVFSLRYFFWDLEYILFDENRYIRYGNYPILQPFDRLSCVGELTVAILATVAHQRLMRLRQNGPKLYLLCRLLNFSVYYMDQIIRYIFFPDVFMQYILLDCVLLLIHILSIVAETVYFKKRAYYFTR